MTSQGADVQNRVCFGANFLKSDARKKRKKGKVNVCHLQVSLFRGWRIIPVGKHRLSDFFIIRDLQNVAFDL